jgi:hypothetical protein
VNEPRPVNGNEPKYAKDNHKSRTLSSAMFHRRGSPELLSRSQFLSFVKNCRSGASASHQHGYWFRF